MEEDYTDTYLRRFKNLKMFKGKTDAEIRQYLRSRPDKIEKPVVEKAIAVRVVPEKSQDIEDDIPDEDYEKLYKRKLKSLQQEYGVDMNDANDAESLKSFVRLSMQQEAVDREIRKLHVGKFIDTKRIKDLGDYQRSLQMSIQGLQGQLGISRKDRIDKQVDDVPKFIAKLKKEGKAFFDRETTAIRCQKDKIELGRVWLNFPKLNNSISMELECWKCHEVILYAI